VPASEYVISAELAEHPGVMRLVSAPGDETLDDLHHLPRVLAAPAPDEATAGT
jgi:hypothetical protein